jgi:hypothetical protein
VYISGNFIKYISGNFIKSVPSSQETQFQSEKEEACFCPTDFGASVLHGKFNHEAD